MNTNFYVQYFLLKNFRSSDKEVHSSFTSCGLKSFKMLSLISISFKGVLNQICSTSADVIPMGISLNGPNGLLNTNDIYIFLAFLSGKINFPIFAL